MPIWLYICTSLCFGWFPKGSQQKIIQCLINSSNLQLPTCQHSAKHLVEQTFTHWRNTNWQPQCRKQFSVHWEAQRAGQLVHVQLWTSSSPELSDFFSWMPLFLKTTINKITVKPALYIKLTWMAGMKEILKRFFLKSYMFMFHIVVNLSSGHDVMKSLGYRKMISTETSNHHYKSGLQDSLDWFVVSLFHFKMLKSNKHTNIDADKHTGAQVPKVWAPEQSGGGGERVKAIRGSCQTCIFGMHWMWGSEIIDWGLAGLKRHEGRGRVMETDVMVTQAPEPPFRLRWNIYWWIPPAAYFNLVERS